MVHHPARPERNWREDSTSTGKPANVADDYREPPSKKLVLTS